MSLAMSCSIDRVASPTSLSCSMDVRKYVFISLSLEKLRSPLATETGSVKRIRRAITVLGTLSVRLFFNIKLSTSCGDVHLATRLEMAFSSLLRSTASVAAPGGAGGG